MEIKDKIKELRESTGMNRKEFCKYFEIPYRTVTEWERGTRKMPDYVLRLLAYKVKMDDLIVKEDVNEDKTLIIVSNEVGMSVVPSYRLGRIFSDISGKANQVLASLSDEVYVAISGLPLRLK